MSSTTIVITLPSGEELDRIANAPLNRWERRGPYIWEGLKQYAGKEVSLKELATIICQIYESKYNELTSLITSMGAMEHHVEDALQRIRVETYPVLGWAIDRLLLFLNLKETSLENIFMEEVRRQWKWKQKI